MPPESQLPRATAESQSVRMQCVMCALLYCSTATTAHSTGSTVHVRTVVSVLLVLYDSFEPKKLRRTIFKLHEVTTLLTTKSDGRRLIVPPNPVDFPTNRPSSIPITASDLVAMIIRLRGVPSPPTPRITNHEGGVSTNPGQYSICGVIAHLCDLVRRIASSLLCLSLRG